MCDKQGRIQDEDWWGGGGGMGVGGGVDLIKLPKFMFSDRRAWVNSVDPDQTLLNVASNQRLHCVPLTQQFHTHSNGLEERL